MILTNCSRLEIIENGKGRIYSNLDVEGAEISVQDDGLTLKVFINYPL